MHEQVFCDESKAGGFRLAAVAVACGDVPRLRKVVSGLKLQGQEKLHFVNESDGHRKQIIKALIDAGVSATIYDATRHRDEKVARDTAISRLTDDAVAMKADRIVLELDESTGAADRITIRNRLVAAGAQDVVRYCHHKAKTECLLSVPDAIVWCFAKGNRWGRLVRPLISDVIPV